MALPRVLEPEAMDSAEEARAYDALDHREVNDAFVERALAVWAPRPDPRVLDLGRGTAGRRLQDRLRVTQSPAMSLRRLAAATAATLTVIALVGAASLAVLTSQLHRLVVELGMAVESVRTAEEVEVNLLAHGQVRDEIARVALGQDLRRLIERAADYVSHARERKMLDEASARVEAYLAQPGAQRLETAFAATERLVDVNRRQSEMAQASAARIDRLANVVGLLVAVTLVVGVGVMLVGLRHYLLSPLLQIGEALARFAGGDRRARVLEGGPAELRMIARQFNAMTDRLGDEEHLRMALVAGVAHDLRNPLSALRLATSRAAFGAQPPSEEQARRIFAIVQRQVDRLDRIAGDLVDAARIQAGHLELRIEPHDLREVVREAADLFAPASDRHPIEVELPDAPVEVRCDAGRLQQVLNNLLTNAIRYSPTGGRVRITLRREVDRAGVAIRDEGIGIAPEEIARLFEPFVRGNAGKATASGVGLGLFVAKRIVEAHGGEITVDSRPGAGTTFEVRLPAGV